MVFGIIPECRSASLWKELSASSESPVDQGKGPHSPAPSNGPHPRSGWTDQLFLENLKRFGTYDAGRSGRRALDRSVPLCISIIATGGSDGMAAEELD